MKIGIIGGGSIGLLFSCYLGKIHEVTLYVRNGKQKEKIESEGIVIYKGNEEHRISVNAEHISAWGEKNEQLTIVCVKQYDLEKLFENRNIKDHPLLFVQNGMGHLKLLEQLPVSTILVGTVEHGALKAGLNSVRHTGEGKTNIALFRGRDKDFVERFISPFSSSFPFHLEEDYWEMLVNKLVVNALINPLTAILRTENGNLVENPHYFQIMKNMFIEVKDILQLEHPDKYFENAVRVCRKTAKNRSSMLKDLDDNRQTEIDAILGFLLDEGKKKQIGAPILQTCYEMVKGRELEGKEMQK